MSADVLDDGLSLSTKGTKSRDYKGDNPHASTRIQEGASGMAQSSHGDRQPLGHDDDEELI